MTKKEKAILKLAQKWANTKLRVDDWNYRAKESKRRCGRALLKILEP